MSRIDATFRALEQKGEKAFMPFLVIGDPDWKTSLSLADGLIRAGADLLEFGIPFSDPPADGPIIQAADQRALASGMNTDRAFDFLARVRTKTEAPIALLLYYNLIYRYGVERFYERAAKSGVDAILVADLPIEEATLALEAAKKYGIAPIFLLSELTTPERLALISPAAQGYYYLVTRLGITGQQESLNHHLSGIVGRLKRQVSLPLLAGFGISRPDQVEEVLKTGVDGAICGSALESRIAQHLHDPQAMVRVVEDFAREMKAATR